MHLAVLGLLSTDGRSGDASLTDAHACVLQHPVSLLEPTHPPSHPCLQSLLAAEKEAAEREEAERQVKKAAAAAAAQHGKGTAAGRPAARAPVATTAHLARLPALPAGARARMAGAVARDVTVPRHVLQSAPSRHAHSGGWMGQGFSDVRALTRSHLLCSCRFGGAITPPLPCLRPRRRRVCAQAQRSQRQHRGAPQPQPRRAAHHAGGGRRKEGSCRGKHNIGWRLAGVPHAAQLVAA